MATQRTVQMAFWTDEKVIDDYTPEDRYFYLYLITNIKTNLCGCYEITHERIARDLGYSIPTARMLVERFQNVHKSIIYNKETKELLLLNWSKYNWTSSEKFRKPLEKEIIRLKDPEFKRYLYQLYSGMENVVIPYSEISSSIYFQIPEEKKISKELEEKLIKNFEIIYNNYPLKKGKTRAYPKYVAWVTTGRIVNGKRVKLKNGQIWDAMQRYIYEMEAKNSEIDFYKHFDTFLGNSLLDYVEGL